MKGKEVMSNLNKINLVYLSPKTRTFCPKCQKPVGLMTFLSATNFYPTEVERIYRLIEREKLHLIQNNQDELMICSDSLFAFLQNEGTQSLALNKLSAQIL
jgi:hypothetical protein